MHEYQRDMERVRANLEVQTHRCADRGPQPPVLRSRSRGGTPAGAQPSTAVFSGPDRHRSVQGNQRPLRSSGRRRNPAASRNCCGRRCGSRDVLFRYGGDEFAAILPDTTVEGAVVIGERLRRTVQRASWPRRTVTPASGSPARTRTSRHRWMCWAPPTGALLDAKANGRNRVSVAGRSRRTCDAGGRGRCVGPHCSRTWLMEHLNGLDRSRPS